MTDSAQIIRYDAEARNVLGGELVPCSLDPVTGFYRNGCCETGPHDTGLHTVCAVMSEAFLAYSKSMGNDLSTPQLVLEATHEETLAIVPLGVLKDFAVSE